MGWAEGSELADEMWKIIRPLTGPANKKRIAKKVVALFEDQDCDTMYECKKLCADAGIENDADE